MNQEQKNNLDRIILSDYQNTAGLVVLKNGNLVYETYFNGCTKNSTIHIYSVTKSIISILIGIALDKGYLRHVEQKVLDFFPDYVTADGDDGIQNITIRHILTMTAPYRFQDEPWLEYFTSDNWLKFSLDSLGGAEPAGRFRYAGLIGPDILSGILVKATGQTVLSFASQHLFAPLGIKVADHIIFHNADEQLAFNEATDISGWVAAPDKINSGGWGLTLTAMDMAKIGQLYLNGGRWEETVVVSPQWIAESTGEHSYWDEAGLPYGYLWWLNAEHKPGFYALGDGGNTIYINPETKTVVAITGLFIPNAPVRLDLIKEHIEPYL